MNRTSHLLVPLAVAAMGLGTLFLSGCGEKEAPKAAVDPSSPESYMKDEAFRQTLKDRRKVAASIGEERSKVTARQEALVKAAGEKLKTSDRAKIVASLATDEEWKDLEKKAKELDAAFEKHRRETLRVVRERIVPKSQDISK